MENRKRNHVRCCIPPSISLIMLGSVTYHEFLVCYRSIGLNDIMVKAMQISRVKKTLKVLYDDIYIQGMASQNIVKSHLQNLDNHKS